MEDFSNVSIPHLQVLHARVQNSKYGPALCIETYKTPLVLSYKLGFQVPSEPPNKLKQMANFIRDLVVSYFENPIFGVQFEESVNVSEQRTCDARDSQATLATDDEEENDGITNEEIPSLLKYITEEEKEDLEFVFDERLGLTVTRPKGSSLKSGDLWKLVG
ncbi:Bardet-Biedl syndrome 5 protein [Rhizoclosmatium sp. JEL0117]|nr:Bardet-Biedl syndrome 5 protein [Rhizoclosmatium sp. JEL0117]